MEQAFKDQGAAFARLAAACRKTEKALSEAAKKIQGGNK